MKPADLDALCDDAIRRFDSGEMIADAPTIMLTVPIRRHPAGQHIRLLGRSGPVGWVAQTRQEAAGLVAIAYFNAHAVKRCIGPALLNAQSRSAQ